ncbi:MAG TPA: hypothetical protein VF510_12800 [Ktedonobacterales bacterium]
MQTPIHSSATPTATPAVTVAPQLTARGVLMACENSTSEQGEQQENVGLTSRVGLIEINWPKTIGYYGGIGVALAAEFIEPPVAVFIAAIPLFKMLSHPKAPKPVRVTGQVLAGAALPVGGDSEAAIHLAPSDASPKQQQHSSIWSEARAIADRQRSERHRVANANG